MEDGSLCWRAALDSGVVVVREGGGYGRGLVDGLLWPLPGPSGTIEIAICVTLIVTCSRTPKGIFTSAALSYPLVLTE